MAWSSSARCRKGIRTSSCSNVSVTKQGRFNSKVPIISPPKKVLKKERKDLLLNYVEFQNYNIKGMLNRTLYHIFNHNNNSF